MDFYDFKDENNAFGGDIQFREGKSIKLLQREEGSDKLILNKEALNIITNIEEPVSIITNG